MCDRKSLRSSAMLAVVGLMASASFAGTDTNAAPNFSLQSDLSLAYQQPEQNGLLQTEMNDHGMGGSMLDQYGLKLTGYVEAGWAFNFDRPEFGSNGQYIDFIDKTDDPTLNQFSLILSREAFASASRLDTGFKLQVIYGSDARFTQANGTNFYGSGSNNRQVPLAPSANNPNPNPHLLVITPGQQYPENEIDILQAYVTVNVPVGNGLMLTAGKFVTPWGMESVDPTKNALYSHSYLFSAGGPLTLTGLMADYRIDDQWTAKAGIVTGWDQSIEDNNSSPSVFAGVGYKYSEDLNGALNIMTGPEKPDNRSDYRWLVDATVNYKVQTEWDMGAEALFGYEDDTGTQLQANGGRLFSFSDGSWWGGAVYSTYRLDNSGMYTLQARGEYFNDAHGARQLITEVYSGTLGLNIRPFVDDRIGKNFMIRPEIRYDWALAKIFDNDTRDNQVVAAIDAVFQF